jgi:hypothetical protein
MRTIQYPHDLQQNALFDTATLDACSWWITDLTDEARRYLESSWQGLFRRWLLKLMPAQSLGDHFSADKGRPSKELYSMAALIFVMEFKNWTIDQTAEEYTLNNGLHFALNLGNRRNYLCPRTVDTYRKLIREDGASAAVFAQVTDALVKELHLEIKRQRLDSTHVLSDMANFGRTKLLAVAIKRFLTSLLRHEREAHAKLPAELIERYSPAVGKLFGEAALHKDSRAAAQLQAAQDMHLLIERFADTATVSQRSTYQALVRIFNEHCELKGAAINLRVKAQDDHGGSAHTLQNPSDPDAGYSGHKGAGYQVQLVETSSSSNDVQLVLACLPQSAAQSDSGAVEPMLEELAKRHLTPEEMAADTAYGSDENHQRAQAQGIDMISPCPGAGTKTGSPAGAAARPLEPTVDEASGGKRRRGRPRLAKRSEKRQALHEKAVRMGQRRERESTDEWREKYAVRAGIEGLNRGLDRRTGLKELRVRGMRAVRHSVYGKVMGWNILQAARGLAKRARKAAKAARLALELIIRPRNWLNTRRKAFLLASHSGIDAGYNLILIASTP